MPGTVTEKGRLVRERIVEATARQILDAGIGGTTLDSVRAATLTSKSQLFHYFPGGKAELVREVARWEAEQLAAAQEPHIHDLGSWESWRAWRAAIEHYYFELGRWACPIGTLATEAATGDDELAGRISDVMTDWRDALAAGVARMQQAGAMRTGTDPQRMAAAVLAAIQGGLLLAQIERASWPLEAAVDTVFAGLEASAR
jgi:AcrR family transcriptional regulator